MKNEKTNGLVEALDHWRYKKKMAVELAKVISRYLLIAVLLALIFWIVKPSSEAEIISRCNKVTIDLRGPDELMHESFVKCLEISNLNKNANQN